MLANEELKNKDTAIFIYEFVKKHGGIQLANKQLLAESTAPAPPLPPRKRSSMGELPDIPPPLTRRDSKPLPPLPPLSVGGVQVLAPPTLPTGNHFYCIANIEITLTQYLLWTMDLSIFAPKLIYFYLSST